MSSGRMEDLAISFPALEGAPGTLPWDAEAFDRWAATSPEPGSGALHAARFVLAVWNDRAPWKAGSFQAISALGTWDGEHRAAFLAWAQAPWFP